MSLKKTRKRFLFILFLTCLHFPTLGQGFSYGTSSEEALIAYHQGWQRILDLGEWTLAEESFRNAVENDPDFLLGWSQVGRISNEPEERMEIYQMLEEKKDEAEGFERELLEVYLGSLKIIDYRDRGLGIKPEMVSEFRDKLFSTSQSFLQIYPEEIYIEAEYMEAIHGIYGAKATLDSMANRQIFDKSAFFKSYQALCFSELCQSKEAMLALDELSELLGTEDSPAFYYTKGRILYDQEKYSEAKKSINKCLELDQKHTLARRMETLLNDY
ncbi:tetratricopeptide repeat protein [Algoriphagus namhaensis]|uniref:Tetratricopeptide repeat protein n=1 Tax=Algoriphagus namhaensis TaxID=915353 RepID=A0ABV8AWS1_9BACT